MPPPMRPRSSTITEPPRAVSSYAADKTALPEPMTTTSRPWAPSNGFAGATSLSIQGDRVFSSTAFMADLLSQGTTAARFECSWTIRDRGGRIPQLARPKPRIDGRQFQRRSGEPIRRNGIILTASSRRDWSRKQALTPNVRASACLRHPNVRASACLRHLGAGVRRLNKSSSLVVYGWNRVHRAPGPRLIDAQACGCGPRQARRQAGHGRRKSAGAAAEIVSRRADRPSIAGSHRKRDAMHASLDRVILYAQDVERLAAFYRD